MSLMAPLALLCGFSLASAALSFFALYRAKAMIQTGERRLQSKLEGCEAVLGILQQRVDGCSSQLQELSLPQPAAGAPVKPGLNLSKRSQALRMHRRGDPPDQIAAALGVPLQEVDLLLKVHRIVMSSV